MERETGKALKNHPTKSFFKEKMPVSEMAQQHVIQSSYRTWYFHPALSTILLKFYDYNWPGGKWPFGWQLRNEVTIYKWSPKALQDATSPLLNKKKVIINTFIYIKVITVCIELKNKSCAFFLVLKGLRHLAYYSQLYVIRSGTLFWCASIHASRTLYT